MIDKDLIIEALIALVEKKDQEYNELAEDHERYFDCFISILDYLLKKHGFNESNKILIESITKKEYLEKAQQYLNDHGKIEEFFGNKDSF